MRKALVMVGALLALTPMTGSSAGIELAWNACFGHAGAAEVMISNCDTNAGSQAMYVSFRPPAGIARLEGIEVFIDYVVPSSPWSCPQTDIGSGPPLPCWWNFANGQLRQDQLVTLHVSPTDANGHPLVRCDNHYFLDQGAAGGGGMLVTGINRGRLLGLAAIPAGTGLPVEAEAQQYGIGFRILNRNTVPAESCSGCTSSACFVVNTVNLTSSGVPNVVLQVPHPGAANWVAWRPNTTPTLKSTWGGIKSLYR